MNESASPSSPSQPETVFSEHAPTILATEHWSLLATRSMAWNEAFTRTSVFLNVLSAAVVALALVADATAFGDAFGMFALVLFPMVLFLGVATFARLIQINRDDAHSVIAMNRLRHAYMTMAPELAPFFMTGWHDDIASVNRTFSLGGAPPKPWVQSFITTPTVIGTIDAIIAAAGGALLASRAGAGTAAMIAVSIGVFVVTWLVLFSAQVRGWVRLRDSHQPAFPPT